MLLARPRPGPSYASASRLV